MRNMGLLPDRKVVPLRRRAKHARHAPWSGAVAGLEARVADLEQRMTALDRRIVAFGKHARIQVALAFSIILHAVIILGVTFKMPELSKPAAQPPLEVTLVNAKTLTPPRKADTLAQANLDGGGDTDTNRRARSPLPVPRESRQAPELTLAQKRVAQLEKQARQLVTRAKSETAVASVPEQPEPKTEPQVAPAAADIMSRSLEIARLEAQISREWDSYQKRPRRRFIGARAQEFRFARYIEDWRIKIERVGELNYPQAARNRKIYGSLVVTVSIRSDGSLDQVDINRPSGQSILDQAAIRIVRLAAPFAPFPADIASDTDILSITRTWVFTRSDQLVTE